jgi:transketolase
MIDFCLGMAIPVREGADCTLISTGTMLHTAVTASDRLAHKGISVRVLSMHTIKPLDIAPILEAACETEAILTLEEHSIQGGLGSAVAEVLAENATGVPFKRLGLPPVFIPEIGSQDYLKDVYSLTPSAVEATIAAFLQQTAGRANARASRAAYTQRQR